MVMTTGMTSSSCAAVLALKVLQNSMILTPCCPRAGPTGGEGLAFPAGTWSFTTAVTFLAMAPLDLLHLEELEVHRRGAAEDADHALEAPLVGFDLVHEAGEVGEGAVNDPEALPLHEVDPVLGLLHPLLDLLHDLGDFAVRDGGGPGPGGDEARYFRGVFDEVREVVRDLHPDEEVTGEELPEGLLPLPLLQFHHLLGRDEELAHPVGHVPGRDLLSDAGLHLSLEARVGVDDVPPVGGGDHLGRGGRRGLALLALRENRLDRRVLGAGGFHRVILAGDCYRRNRPTSFWRPRSTSPRKKETRKTETMTTRVDPMISFFWGQETLSISVRTSRR